MAAPNLVNVSSIYGKTVGADLGTSIAAVLSNAGSSNKVFKINSIYVTNIDCLLYTSPSPRDRSLSRMPSSA